MSSVALVFAGALVSLPGLRVHDEMVLGVSCHSALWGIILSLLGGL